MLPLLVGGGALLGGRMAVPLSRLSDRVVLAERLSLEEAGVLSEPSVATDGYRRSKQSSQMLYAEALDIRQRIGRAGWWLGACLGLVVGARLIALSLQRQRADYEPHRGNCLSCGRCFRYCPKEATQ